MIYGWEILALEAQLENDGPGAPAKAFGSPSGSSLPVTLDWVKGEAEGANPGTTSPGLSAPRFPMAGSNPAQVAYMLTRQNSAAPPPATPAVQSPLQAPLAPAASNPLQVLARPSMPMMDMRSRQASPPQASSPSGSSNTWFDAVRARVDAINADTGPAASTIDITAGDSRVVRAAPPPRLKQRVTLDLLASKCGAVSAGLLKWKAFDDFLGLAKDRLERVHGRLLARRGTKSAGARAEVAVALKSLGDSVGLMKQAAGRQDLALLEAAMRAAVESDDMLERARAMMAAPSGAPEAPPAASSRVA